MKLGRVVLTWIGRNAVALSLIILILLFARHAAPPAADWLGAQSQTLRTVPAQQAAYAEAARGFEAYAPHRLSQAEAAAAALA
ncbi:MAG: hypothetical protein M3M95_05345, partial [Pseudomonadota bacterium]|nr:hypothetical protein [Pseudomonadota bacterium]